MKAQNVAAPLDYYALPRLTKADTCLSDAPA